jgi:hypothetical protein
VVPQLSLREARETIRQEPEISLALAADRDASHPDDADLILLADVTARPWCRIIREGVI